MIWWGDFLDYLRLYRIVWLGGRFGGGKTVLAVRAARELLRRDKLRFVSNLPVEGASRLFPPDAPIDDSVVLLDEAAEVVDARGGGESFKALAGFRYARHFGLIFLLPSIDMVEKRLRKLVVTSVAELTWASLGLRRVFLYRWWVGPSPDPPLRRERKAQGWILFCPGARDWGFDSRHKGRGLTTLPILQRLHREVRGLESGRYESFAQWQAKTREGEVR